MELIVSAHCSKIQKALTEMQKLLYCFLTLDATKHSLAVTGVAASTAILQMLLFFDISGNNL